MNLRNAPIQRKLMTVIMLTCVVVMLMMVLAFFGYEVVTFRRAALRQLTILGQVTASNSTAALAFSIPEDAAEILAALRAEEYITAAALYDSGGALFSRYPAALPDAALPAEPGTAGYRYRSGELVGFEPVEQGRRALGMLYLQLDAAAMLHDWLQGVFGIGALVTALVLVLAFLVSRTLQTEISRPILALADTARIVSEARDYSVRAEKHGDDELGLLTSAFNHMLGQIETQDSEIRQLNRGLELRVVERTAELKAANAELEAFSYSVSHDLRAPLRHIGGYAQLLRKRIEGKIDDTDRRYFDTIVNSTAGLGTLIDELLTFSRTGRAELCRTAVDTKTLVNEVIQDLQPDCEGRCVEWRIGDLSVVQADAGMLRQVWRNLLGNAVKYTRRCHRAIVEIAEVESGEERVFRVSDNGAGFSMEHASKLFGVFQRLHAATEFEGTGIGLANVRRIVERHGGRTWAEGEKGQGARFYFSLPTNA